MTSTNRSILSPTLREVIGRVPVARMGLLLALALAIPMLVSPRAHAQSAPAGNAHPQSNMVSAAAGESETPVFAAFGMPTPESSLTPEAKASFADAVDIGPLRDLAVFHNGRVKILDTLAAETVRTITGKPQYRERLFAKGADVAAIRAANNDGHDHGDYSWRYHISEDVFDEHKFNPLFTLLDMAIDPAYYQNRPLIGVDFLPLREEFLVRAVRDQLEHERPGSATVDSVVARVEIWKRAGRVTPAMIDTFAEGIYRERVSSAGIAAEPWRKALDGVDLANRIYRFSAGNFQVIAPEDRTDSWHRLTELDASDPVRRAAIELGNAWRMGDAPGANAAIATLAQLIPTVNAELYPQGRRSIELVYNQTNAFEWGFWLYLFALIALLLAFGTGRKWLIAVGIATLVAAVGLHSFGFVSRCIIAERLAIQNQYESMTGLSLLASLVGTIIMLARRQWLFGAAAAAVGFMVLIVATQTGIPGVRIEREAAILNTSVLLKYHVTTVLASYGLIALGFVCSLFYLGAHYGKKLMGGTDDGGLNSEAQLVAAAALKGNASVADSDRPTHARLLDDLDKAQMIVLQLAFWTLGVGILLGAWWADHSWGRWWAFDPKETWALITWIIYLIVIHVRRTGLKNKGLTTAWLSLVGFIIMLWTYFGVNLLLPGLHAYA